jgi:diguanylate cyclase (GGDEF)-like protein
MKRHTYGLALAGLAAVLIALSAFGLWSTARTSAASTKASTATRLSDVYEQARYAVGQEESLERKYRIEPGPDVLARYHAAARDLEHALTEMQAVGLPEDRRDSAEVLAVHARYLEATTEMFAAVDAGDTARVLFIDGHRTDPLFSVIEKRVDAEASHHHAVAQQSLRDLRANDSFVSTATLVAFSAGLLLLAFFATLLSRVKRTLAEQAAAREHQALHDPLTGLPNRVLFSDRLEHAVRSASRNPAPFSLLMIDLDRFKEINDSLGHATGDLLLMAAAARLETALRPGDTVARLGGDEFALLLPETDGDGARHVAERALEALREPLSLPTVIVAIDASVGLVTYPADGRTAETLLQRADVAMYLAKRHGGGAMRYDAGRDPNDPERLALASELRTAIDRDELELHYQPKFHTQTLALPGVEALVRWRHPERGLLFPDAFIPLAEHTGMIRDVTQSVLRMATSQLAAWRADGLDLRVAVNLSVANLLDHRLVDDVATILDEAAVPADRLELEITETMLMTDPERATILLEQLSEMGIRLSIDDFGTGYSSLAYMRGLPISEVKIDRSFVKHLAVSDSDAAIVRSTIDLSHSLALQVVAEGVEDAQSLELLRDFGCDSAQGYHLARPAPAEALGEMLARHAASLRA